MKISVKNVKIQVSLFLGKSEILNFFTRLVTCNWDLGFVDTLPRRKFC